MLLRCQTTGKVIHKTKEKAISVVKRHHKDNKVIMNVFKCNTCKGWHLGRSRRDYRFQTLIDLVLEKDRRR